MDRLNSAKTIEDLIALTRSDLARQVDVLVDAYLVDSDPGQLWQKRAELAQGFLNAAPLSELSYRIWRRIAGEDDDEIPSQSASMEFLPPVEFHISR
jgi:DNA-binding IclR family transcriptional regulator